VRSIGAIIRSAPRLARSAAVIAAAAAFLSLPGGCGDAGGKGTAPDGRVVISYWEKWTGFEKDAMQAIVDDYNTSQSRVRVELLPVSDISQKVMLASAGGNPPDVAGLYSDDVFPYARRGALIPLDSLGALERVSKKDYLPVYWRQCEHFGMLWALPSTPTSIALHWNKKLFREAGLDPDRPPRTIAELDEMCDRLTVVELWRNGEMARVRYSELSEDERRKKDFRIVRLGFSPLEPGWWSPYWGLWFGGRIWDPETKTLTPDSKGDIEAFEWIRSFPERYGVDNIRSFDSSFGNFASPRNPFLSGKVAMELQGVWMHNFIEKYAPNMEWGAAPFPTKDGKGTVTVAESDVLAIPRGAKHPRDALDFILYVNRRKTMEKLCLLQRKFTPLRAVSPDFYARHPNPYIKMFRSLAESPGAYGTPPIPILNEYADGLEAAAERVFFMIDTPRDALEGVRKRFEKRLRQYYKRWAMVKDRRLEEWRRTR